MTLSKSHLVNKKPAKNRNKSRNRRRSCHHRRAGGGGSVGWGGGPGTTPAAAGSPLFATRLGEPGGGGGEGRDGDVAAQPAKHRWQRRRRARRQLRHGHPWVQDLLKPTKSHRNGVSGRAARGHGAGGVGGTPTRRHPAPPAFGAVSPLRVGGGILGTDPAKLPPALQLSSTLRPPAPPTLLPPRSFSHDLDPSFSPAPS